MPRRLRPFKPECVIALRQGVDLAVLPQRRPWLGFIVLFRDPVRWGRQERRRARGAWDGRRAALGRDWRLLCEKDPALAESVLAALRERYSS